MGLIERLRGDAGLAAARLVQRGQTAFSQIPVLSLVQDVMNEHHGIDELRAVVRSEPDHLYGFLWLGEALQARERDMSVYLAARAVVEPSSALVRQAITTIGRQGRPASKLAPSEKNLRHAYALALTQVARNNGDADAYHVIARCYLAAGRAAGGLKAAKMAVVTAHGELRGHSMYTLARIYLATDCPTQASAAANAATRAGFSLGNKVLAELSFRSAASGRLLQKSREGALLNSRVQTKDLETYHGRYRSADTKLQAIVGRQVSKSKALYDRMPSRRTEPAGVRTPS